MSSQPKISIIIPVYNAENTLKQSLDSAIRQTLHDIEIICVDDASTDASAHILSEYAASDTRIRIIRHDENKGEGGARNTGLDQANGEYVFHLDADDTLPADALEKLYMEAHMHGSDMVKGRYDLIFADGSIVEQAWSAPDHKVINTNIVKSDFLKQIPTSHCSYIYRRKFLNKHNIRYRTDLVVGLDLIALATALIQANSVTLIPDVVLYYFQSDSSATRGEIPLKTALDAVASKRIVSDMLKQCGQPDAADFRLKKWEFIIDSFFRKMPTSLTLEECSQVFSDFRELISEYAIIPWMTDTPHHYRYTLALIRSGRDEEALSFLSTNQAIGGFTDNYRLKDALEFVLSQAPEDAGAFSGLGAIARNEARFEDALNMYEKVQQLEPNNTEAQLQITAILIQLEKFNEAGERINNALQNLAPDTEISRQISRITTLSYHLNRSKDIICQGKLNTLHDRLSDTNTELHQSNEKLRKTSNDLKQAKNELNAIYTSLSWRITRPLRKALAIIRGKK